MELKQERLSLRLTSEEKKLIRKRVIDKNMKISEYIMDLVEIILLLNILLYLMMIHDLLQ